MFYSVTTQNGGKVHFREEEISLFGSNGQGGHFIQLRGIAIAVKRSEYDALLASLEAQGTPFTDVSEAQDAPAVNPAIVRRHLLRHLGLDEPGMGNAPS